MVNLTLGRILDHASSTRVIIIIIDVAVVENISFIVLPLFGRGEQESLNCCQPQMEPRVSEKIPQILDTIQKIIDREHAYRTPDGDVYFSIESLPCRFEYYTFPR